MAEELNACEVLDIAETMERNAARFYRKAAGVCDDSKLCKLFVELAQWEKRHVQMFAEMRDRLSKPSGKSGRFALEQVKGSVAEPLTPPVFGGADDPADELAGNPTKSDVLKMAIRKEEDTIAYYTGLREFVPGQNNTQVIQGIIEEERRHVRLLAQSLEQAYE
ncbi:MAG: hypothetical protein A2Y76_00445 [Planctomycetes bacterium RBG_13_60_9]|nr:MAG: hypothetical protein A2Y76_00445 [Planctomycetes bacterium RBG_13_60_9]